MSKKDEATLDFEAALDELEKLVARMEEGDLPLEETLKLFERGMELTRQCQKALADAEQKRGNSVSPPRHCGPCPSPANLFRLSCFGIFLLHW